jgi:monoamine oxidase
MKIAQPRAFRHAAPAHGNQSDTMPRLSRRSFLAASALFATARPGFAAKPAGETADVYVIGAGAAGIAAARRLQAANLNVLVFEARDRIGGRCTTDTASFGVSFDLGAHWIHGPEGNPLVAVSPKDGLYPAPRWPSVRIGPRAARDSELEIFLAAEVRAQRALRETPRGRTDPAAQALLPRDLGAWKPAIEFLLGPYAVSKDLADVSVADVTRQAERYAESFAPQGYGALLERRAAALKVRTSTPVSRIAWARGTVLETKESLWYPRGAVILTCSTNALTRQGIEFDPPLPKRVRDAAEQLALGSLDHIALDMPGNPLGLQKDDFIIEQASGPRTAALLANISGTSLHIVTVGGAFGRELSGRGEQAMIDFAVQWLDTLFSTSVKRRIKKSYATRWNAQKYVYGAMSVATPGHAEARRALMEPFGRVWLAGEALHETKWGTVEGAWESGVRAAEAVIRVVGRDKPREERSKKRRR